MTSRKPSMFVREATGLVKELSPTDGFILGFMYIAIPFVLTFGFVSAPALYPGADMNVTLLITLIPALLLGIMYLLLAIAMPRTGGDYVWTSRIIHPLAGFANNWFYTIGLALYFGVNLAIAVPFAIGSFISSEGIGLGIASLTNLGGTLSTDRNWGFAAGTIVMLVFTLVMIRGLKALMKLQYALFILSMSGTVVGLIILAMSSNAAFIQAFNKNAQGVTTYNGILTLAKTAGFAQQDYNRSLAASLAALPLGFFFFEGWTVPVYFAGEFKNIKRSMVFSIVISLLVGAFFYVLSGFLYYHLVGFNWNSAIGYLYSNASSQYPLSFAPSFQYFNAILTSNPVLFTWIAISGAASAIGFLNVFYLICSRNMFAWAFDRVMPARLADVNERFHTPINSILVTLVLAEVALAIYMYTTIFTLIANFVLILGLAYFIPGIAGIIFPFVKKDLFDLSPSIVKKRIAGIPVVSMCGVATLLLASGITYASIINPSISGPTGLEANIFIVVLAISGIVAYYLSHWYRKKEGIDLNMVFREIPPE